jgi:hypothetical protein
MMLGIPLLLIWVAALTVHGVWTRALDGRTAS